MLNEAIIKLVSVLRAKKYEDTDSEFLYNCPTYVTNWGKGQVFFSQYDPYAKEIVKHTQQIALWYSYKENGSFHLHRFWITEECVLDTDVFNILKSELC